MIELKIVHEMNTEQWLRDSAKSLVEAAAAAIEGRAAALAPVDTSTLHDSIKRTPISDVEAEVGTNVHYAIHQEYGTRYQRGKAFLRPAVDETKRDMNRLWQSAKERG